MAAGKELDDGADTSVPAFHTSRDRTWHQELPQSLSAPSTQSSLHSTALMQLLSCNRNNTAPRLGSQLIHSRGQGCAFLRSVFQKEAHCLGWEALTEIKQSLIILRCQNTVPPKNTKSLGDRHRRDL